MPLKIFYDEKKSEWKGFEKPKFIDDMYHVENCLNDKAINDAAKNSFKILNPEVIKIGDLQDNGAFIFPAEVQKGKYYQWPGTYKRVLSKYDSDGDYFVLTPPAALEPNYSKKSNSSNAKLEEESQEEIEIKLGSPLSEAWQKITQLQNDLAAERKKNEELRESVKELSVIVQRYMDTTKPKTF